MAKRRTKQHKKATQVRRTTEAVVSMSADQSGPATLSYRAPVEKTGTRAAATNVPAVGASWMQRDQTQEILRQPLTLIYQDLIKTGLVTVGVFGILMFLTLYLK